MSPAPPLLKAGVRRGGRRELDAHGPEEYLRASRTARALLVAVELAYVTFNAKDFSQSNLIPQFLLGAGRAGGGSFQPAGGRRDRGFLVRTAFLFPNSPGPWD